MKIKGIWNFVSKNWERGLFSMTGLGLFIQAFSNIRSAPIADTSIFFGLGFFCFIFGNLSRFKHFKAFGVEGELWEDKQKEAAELIDRLKDIVSIYTEEILLNKVQKNRFDTSPPWEATWSLFNKMTTQHENLGQKIDFSEIKKTLDGYMMLDIVAPLLSGPMEKLLDGKRQAITKINLLYPQPGSNVAEYHTKLRQIEQIVTEIPLSSLIEICRNGNIGTYIINWFEKEKNTLATQFAVNISLDQTEEIALMDLAKFGQTRPIVVTSALIDKANKRHEH